MKKLIAIAVVFALVAVGAFAEANIGGGVGFGALLLAGDNSEKGDDDPAVFTNLNAHWTSVTFTWQSDDNVSGGKIKMNGTMNKKGGDGDPPGKLGGEIWWKPLDALKIGFINIEDEGKFGRGNAIDWGYQSNSAAGNATTFWGGGWNSFSNARVRSGVGFFGGAGGGGDAATSSLLYLSLTPVEGLAINLGWTSWGDTKELFKRTTAQLTYDISGIGNLAVSFKGKEGYATAGYRSAETVAFDFSLSALEGMNIEIGAKIPIMGKDWDGEKDLSFPMEIGLGFAMNQWSGDPLKLFSRVGVLLPSEDFGDITAIGFDINPSYDVGIGRIYVDVGIALAMQKDNDYSDFFWHLSPYLRKGIGVGDLYIGLSIWNGYPQDGYEGLWAIQKGDGYKELINFAVPLHFEISF